jgi:hypothetical protein
VLSGKLEPAGELAVVSLVNSVKQQLKQQQQLVAASPTLSEAERVLSQKQEEVERWSIALQSLSVASIALPDELLLAGEVKALHTLRNRLVEVLESIHTQRAVLSAMLEIAQGLCRHAASSTPNEILETFAALGVVLVEEGFGEATTEVDLRYLVSLLAGEVNDWLCSTLLHLCGATHPSGEDTLRVTELDEVFTIGTETSRALLQLAVRSTHNSNVRYR